jgi:hypothetical protein
MKRTSVLVFVFGALLFSVSVVSAAVLNYSSHLSGRYEIPFVVDTDAQGQAVFQMQEDGMGMAYQVNVANIDNVIMAHIHQMPPSGSGNGPIIPGCTRAAASVDPRNDEWSLPKVCCMASMLVDYNSDSVRT